PADALRGGRLPAATRRSPRRSMSVRSALKTALEAGLAHSGIAGLPRARLSRQALVLAYHNVVPDDCGPCGDRSLHLPHRSFVHQLDHLLRTCSVVPLAEILTPAPSRERRPRVAITFDDGYRGAVTLAVEELAQRGVPAAHLASELTRPLDWLRQRFSSVIPWLTYPYGFATPAVAAAAATAGYRGALCLGNGWFSPDSVNRYAVPRLNVPSGLSQHGFV